jgi:hypothetical protein
MATKSSLARMVASQRKGGDSIEEETDVAPAPVAKKPRKAPTKTSAAKKSASKPAPVAKKPAGEVPLLAALATNPIETIEQMPGVKRGAPRRALNVDLPPELGEWVVAWCSKNKITQRELYRALLAGLRDYPAGRKPSAKASSLEKFGATPLETLEALPAVRRGAGRRTICPLI